MGLTNWFRRKTAPLAGAPAIRRIKTYAAQTGYIYRYCYEGCRKCGPAGVEFVFRLFTGSKDGDILTVRVPWAALRAWEEARARQLTSTQRYAVAKMALFQAFDERPTPAHMLRDVAVRPADLEAILDTLGV